MGGFGVMDFMVKSAKNNSSLLKRKKSLKTIYQENNLHYVKKKVTEKTKHFDEDRKRIFLEKFHARQKKVRRKLTILLIIIVSIFSSIFLMIF